MADGRERHDHSKTPREELHQVLVECADRLERLHPMDPREPCIIYVVWMTAKAALAVLDHKL